MFDKIKEIIISVVNYDKDKITLDSDFDKDLNLDSLLMLELAISIEETFSIEMSSDDISKIHTVGELFSFLKSKGVNE